MGGVSGSFAPKTSSLGIFTLRRYWPCTVLICFQRSLRTFPQSLHSLRTPWKGYQALVSFSTNIFERLPLCTASMCGSRLDFVVNIFPQCGQGSDSSFIPMWMVRTCLSRWPFLLKTLPHSSHLAGLKICSPRWTCSMWRFNVHFLDSNLQQWGHTTPSTSGWHAYKLKNFVICHSLIFLKCRRSLLWVLVRVYFKKKIWDFSEFQENLSKFLVAFCFLISDVRLLTKFQKY